MSPVESLLVGALAVCSIATGLLIVSMLAAEATVLWKPLSRACLWIVAALSMLMCIPCLWYMFYEKHPLEVHELAIIAMILMSHLTVDVLVGSVIYRSWKIPGTMARDMRIFTKPEPICNAMQFTKQRHHV